VYVRNTDPRTAADAVEEHVEGVLARLPKNWLLDRVDPPSPTEGGEIATLSADVHVSKTVALSP
jgi:hypothetical protein